MGMSKSHRIILLLLIDSLFFLLELVVGYSVHSLALVADSFHMLNDVLSLCVGLWAVKVANERTSSKVYTYGWQRAETLGALVNGVFLVALCLSIFLEAIQRFVEPQVVRNPKLVFVVGCCGLVSNILGLVLFHDHSHAHSGGTEAVDTAEQGYIQEPGTGGIADESVTVASAAPENGISRLSAEERGATENNTSTPGASRWSESDANKRRNSRRFSASVQWPFRDSEDIQIHPAILRRDIIEASRFDGSDAEYPLNGPRPSEQTDLLSDYDGTPYTHLNGQEQVRMIPKAASHEDLHGEHNHARPKTHDVKGGHSHSHGDLNMRGVFLHVVGDALGNVGVIISALVIWLTDYSWRYYVDPGISLVITFIILCSAIPLCKAASRILLQAVPPDLSIDHIIEDIQSLPGIISCHHLHVWQLSDTQLVCSLHIQVSHDVKGEGSDRYMELARQVRRCLHAYGIHSSTIQPEFYPDSDADDAAGGSATTSNSPKGGAQRCHGSNTVDPNCLLECGVECADGQQCCPGGK
ncbi:zinc/cadmium resistance protein [Histoplasma capsulatum]|uniref:Zinc/cadmium resistance protein n=1 Tax=Ajellomyces capsulatus TaxID=5037 RepID=A0A8A1MBR9_AJECA|nr:zinc homeostasis factor 1 [Histoplasma mississippiense (nom. inval.)]EDN07747.1 zinc homeostasis factor 1 [Histoplasma mississippiense (nom. inval.)]QSS62163.1 zinc/cadmium resistance protein [Histoplasma capsulatum]